MLWVNFYECSTCLTIHSLISHRNELVLIIGFYYYLVKSASQYFEESEINNPYIYMCVCVCVCVCVFLNSSRSLWTPSSIYKMWVFYSFFLFFSISLLLCWNFKITIQIWNGPSTASCFQMVITFLFFDFDLCTIWSMELLTSWASKSCVLP